MPEKVMGERIDKAFKLAKSKKESSITYCMFYFEYYLPYEKVDSSSDLRFSYMQIFDQLEKSGKVHEEGMVWRVKV